MKIFLLTYGSTDGEYGYFLSNGNKCFTTLEKAREYGRQLEKNGYRNFLSIPVEELEDYNNIIYYYEIEEIIVE